MKALPFKLLSLIMVLAIFLTVSRTPVAAQEPEPTETPPPPVTELPPDLSSLLADDIMPPTGKIEVEPSAAADYKIIPILFVPSDLTPNPFALQAIDGQMQLVQRWYGEQLRRKTFSLEPARLVIGSQPHPYYYGACFPPTSSCAWGYELWGNIFNDLQNLGYPWEYNRVLGVFFQENGVAGVALGGFNQFLVSIDPTMVFGDCLEPGCSWSVSTGGVAHELGHALGLPHPAEDPEGSPGKSVMGWGFYSFPRVTFVNTSTNPERDHLYASPFINVVSSLKNGGFEGCLTFWEVSAGTPACPSTAQLSGLSALALSPGGSSQAKLKQTVTAVAGKSYDISGWLNIPSQTSNFRLQIKVQALSSSDEILSAFTMADYTSGTNGWQRRAISMMMPSRTTKASIRIIAQGVSAPVYIDDLDFHLAQQLPPSPMPVFYSNGDAVPDLRPKLRWSNTTSATSFRLQIATDSSFSGPLISGRVTSPFYRVPKDLLSYDTIYFWRVRANNGAGQSGWSPTWRFIPRSASNYYNDEFETGSLSSAWFWVREDATHWNFGGPLGLRGYGYMGITTQAGDLLGNMNNARNLLLRNSPFGDFEVSTTYDFWEVISTEYQQGGLIIYRNDDNYLKLVRIYDGYHRIKWLAEVNGVTLHQASTPIADRVPIKIARTGNLYSGYYSPDGVSWQRLGQSIRVGWSSPKIGLIAYSRRDVPQITAYFNYFRVKTSDQLMTITGYVGEDYKIFLPFIWK